MKKTVTFSIVGMHCLSCEQHIESALRKDKGVLKADVNLEAREVKVQFDPACVTPDELKETIMAAGYEVAACRCGAPIDEQQTVQAFSQEMGRYPYLFGMAASVAVVGFYLGLITLASDWSNAWIQFTQYRFWILALAAGLGGQIALFSFLRIRLQGRNMRAAKSGLAASGGMSTTSMAVCCAHYLAAFLPFLGLSFLSPVAASLAEYQREFFSLGLISNLVGIGIMLRVMDKHGIFQFRTWINSINLGFSRP